MRILPTLLLLGLLAGCGPTMSFTPAPQTGHYRNAAQNFCLQVPKEWEIREGLAGQVVVCLSPTKGGDAFRENLVVTTEPKTQDAVALREEVKKRLTAEVPGWEVKSQGDTPHPWMVGTHQQLGAQLSALVVTAPGKTSGLVLTFTAPTADFATWDPIFREVVAQLHLDLSECKEPVPTASITPGTTPATPAPEATTPTPATTP